MVCSCNPKLQSYLQVFGFTSKYHDIICLAACLTRLDMIYCKPVFETTQCYTTFLEDFFQDNIPH